MLHKVQTRDTYPCKILAINNPILINMTAEWRVGGFREKRSEHVKAHVHWSRETCYSHLGAGIRLKSLCSKSLTSQYQLNVRSETCQERDGARLELNTGPCTGTDTRAISTIWFKIQDYFISFEKLKRCWTLTTSQYTIIWHMLYLFLGLKEKLLKIRNLCIKQTSNLRK